MKRKQLEYPEKNKRMIENSTLDQVRGEEQRSMQPMSTKAGYTLKTLDELQELC